MSSLQFHQDLHSLYLICFSCHKKASRGKCNYLTRIFFTKINLQSALISKTCFFDQASNLKTRKYWLDPPAIACVIGRNIWRCKNYAAAALLGSNLCNRNWKEWKLYLCETILLLKSFLKISSLKFGPSVALSVDKFPCIGCGPSIW